jgi:L-alanine-DL-glutamate epimerase-like enolase superfamily enzyme
MLIESVRIDTLEVPFSQPFETATGRWRARRIVIVRLGTADGLEGVGEVAAEAPRGIRAPIDAVDMQGLIGTDASDIANGDLAIDAAMGGSMMAVPDGSGPPPSLRSAIASAAADLLARAGGVSIAATLARHPRSEVRVNALIGINSLPIVADQAATLAKRGFDCFKLKAGAEPVAVLIGRVAAVREAVGPHATLRVDLNGALEPASALTLLEKLEPLGLEYVEQPLAARHGATAYAALRRRSPVPIAADESVLDLRAAEALLEADAVDVLVIKPARVGGIRAAHRVARLAAEADVAVVISTLFETGIGIAGGLQLAAALPSDMAHGLATAGLLEDDLVEHSLVIADGRMTLPHGIGLGVELDEDAMSTRLIS